MVRVAGSSGKATFLPVAGTGDIPGMMGLNVAVCVPVILTVNVTLSPCTLKLLALNFQSGKALISAPCKARKSALPTGCGTGPLNLKSSVMLSPALAVFPASNEARVSRTNFSASITIFLSGPYFLMNRMLLYDALVGGGAKKQKIT